MGSIVAFGVLLFLVSRVSRSEVVARVARVQAVTADGPFDETEYQTHIFVSDCVDPLFAFKMKI